MSAYTDWKYGLITDAEYNTICREEYQRDKDAYLSDEWDESEDFFEDDEIDEF